MEERKLKHIPKLWSKSYIFILLVNLFVYLAFYMLVPTLPAYVKQMGGSSLQASLVVSIFSITSLIVRLVSGSVLDKIEIMPILLIGMFILAASTFSYIWVSIIGIILIRIIQGVGWGLSSTSMATVISNIVPKERRGEGMGYYSLSMIVSMSLAPIVAIMVMNKYSFNIISIVSIVLVCIGILLLKGVAIPKNKVKSKSNKKRSQLFGKSYLKKEHYFHLSLFFISYYIMWNYELYNVIW